MDKEKNKPKFTKEQKNLIDSYKAFSANTIMSLINSGKRKVKDIEEVVKYLEENRDYIEYPLYLTCKDYFEYGCNSMQTNFFVNLILSAFFGGSIGILFTMLFKVQDYWFYALLTAIISFLIAISYTIIKKYRKKV